MSSIVLASLPAAIPYAYSYTDSALEIEKTVREALSAIPPEDFEGVLRPAFAEDEIKLILVGAALGLAAGMAQLFLFFPSSAKELR